MTLNVKVTVDKHYPKVSHEEVERIVLRAGCRINGINPDIVVVVGGDGLFGKVGRYEDTPLLFVGTRSDKANGTMAVMSEILYDELEEALKRIAMGQYWVVEKPRLAVWVDERFVGTVFTDVYLQRGAEPTSLRYTVRTSEAGAPIVEHAIGDGVVVTTRAGASGYYSYLDKIGAGNLFEPGRAALVSNDEIGICHIVPTALTREGSERRELRFSVGIESEVELSLDREASAFLYGLDSPVAVHVGTSVKIFKSKSVTRLVKRGR
ncbi:MAG: hypothetical protein JRN62_02715 [Nitrososphaerota archaeon]|jgi:hypothetical protein|nr:hypothetical protein [Nitrososphaerota archaeon]MDG6948908.1 hypothetical protein [Nitrososphaerota archaeon]